MTKKDISFRLSLLANKLRFTHSHAEETGDRTLAISCRKRFNLMSKLVYHAGGHVYDHHTHSEVVL